MKFAPSRAFINTLLALLLGVCCCVSFADDQGPDFQFDIAKQPLDTALLILSAQANVDVLADSELLAPFSSPAVVGKMSLAKAVEQLLNGTGLEYKISQNQRITIFKAALKQP